jgi:hypothetical protein
MHKAWAALPCAVLMTACVTVTTVDSKPDAGPKPSTVDESDSGETPPAPDTEVAEAVSATLGNQGGELVIEQLAQVVVPESALPEDVELKAREIPMGQLPVALPLNAAGAVVELTPHGRLFDQPITIKLNYDPAAPVGNLAVMRLDDPADVDWEQVEGARFENGVASFESTTFSYYTVVTFPEATCTNLPTATKACSGTCSAQQYCSSAAACTPIAQNTLCGNGKIYALESGESSTDNPAAEAMAAAFASHCGGSVTSASIQDQALVQACSSELLLGGGNTLIFAGGPFTNAALRYLDRRISPAFIDTTDGSMQQFKTRSGSVLAQVDPATLSASHDFFMIQIFPDTARGALVISAFGRDGPGTRAASYYFTNVVVPALHNNTRSWSSYVVVEWTDSGDLIANAADTYRVLASDPLPPPPPVTPPPPTTETPYQTGADGTLTINQSLSAAAGYKFTPLVNGKVTALGGYFSGTKTVKLFKGTTQLATASVVGNNSWVYTNITAVALTANTQYTVAVYLSGSSAAKRTSGSTLPKQYGNIRIDAPTQASTSIFNQNPVPTTSSSPTTTMNGLADIKFIKD